MARVGTHHDDGGQSQTWASVLGTIHIITCPRHAFQPLPPPCVGCLSVSTVGACVAIATCPPSSVCRTKSYCRFTPSKSLHLPCQTILAVMVLQNLRAISACIYETYTYCLSVYDGPTSTRLLRLPDQHHLSARLHAASRCFALLRATLRPWCLFPCSCSGSTLLQL